MPGSLRDAHEALAMAMDVKETVRTHHVDDSNPYEIVSKAVEDEFRSGSPSSPRLHALLEVRDRFRAHAHAETFAAEKEALWQRQFERAVSLIQEDTAS